MARLTSWAHFALFRVAPASLDVQAGALENDGMAPRAFKFLKNKRPVK